MIQDKDRLIVLEDHEQRLEALEAAVKALQPTQAAPAAAPAADKPQGGA